MRVVRIYIFVFLFLAWQTHQTIVLAGDNPLKLRTENFLITGDASEKDLRLTAFKLEKFREVFTKSFPALKFNSPIPTTVLVLKSEESFDLYKPRNQSHVDSNGYFQIGEDTNYIVVSTEKLKTDSFQSIYHQYSHFLIDNALGKSNIPAWFYEGLAEYFEDFQIDENGIAVFGNSKSNHVELLENNLLIPFTTFLNIDYYTVRQQEKVEGEGLFYAQSWALTHWMMLENNRANFLKLVNQISTGRSFSESFLTSFQTDFVGIEKNLKNYIQEKSFSSSQKVLESNLKLDISAASEVELTIQIANLLYNQNRFDEAEQLLQKVSNLEPNSSVAVSLLGLIKVRQFKYEEAEILANKAIEIDDENYLNYFRYAYILSRRGMTEYGFVSGYNFAAADKMRDALKKAISLNPNFAESYNLFALISFVRNDELEEALQFVGKALQIAPGNQQYSIRLAEINLRKGRFTEARKTTLNVLQTASEPALRLYAQNTLQRIDSTEAQLLQNKRDNDKYINDDRVTDEPMSDEEIARRRAKAVLDSIRSGLRKPLDGQKRISGNLIEIECLSKQITFVFKTEKQNIKLYTDSLEGINLMTFNQNMYKKEIGCGVVTRENNAVIIYRENASLNSKIIGEIISIEFVPNEFKLNIAVAKP